MAHKVRRVYATLAMVLIIASLGTLGFSILQAQAGQGASTPLPYPPPQTVTPPLPTYPPSPQTPPAPTPTPPPSEWAQIALTYISTRYAVPLESLLIVNEHARHYPLTNLTFRAFTLLDTRTSQSPEYSLLINVLTGEITENRAALEAAEDAAYLTQYGKLQPALHERLQEVTDNTRLPVAIWVANQGAQRTEAELYAELAARFPEAAAALARGTKPTDVTDPALSERIQDTYRQLLAQDVAARTQPLVDWLQAQGFTVESQAGMPSLTARLPKSAILELAGREDVGMIYLTEEKETIEMDTAAPTDRVPQVWKQGITGSGRSVAIIEPGNIDTGVSCLNISPTKRISPWGTQDHASRMASIVNCNADPYRGVAYGSLLINAGEDATESDVVAALQWAIQSPQNADVANFSGGFQADNYLNWTDRAFDYWARIENVTIVKSAGNTGSSITSPGKAWNIITIGGTDDRNNANWADDIIWASSSYINPAGGDREKPEVVAPAVSISSPGGYGGTPQSGTSSAAAQVSGLAALLVQRTSSLTVWPEAIKAIIMASAIHNIDGPSDIPTGQELKDGAGAIDAALADAIAKNVQTSGTVCNSPCWWGVLTSNTNPPVTGSLYQYFKVSRGERIRVAISWFSHADSPIYPCCGSLARDALDTNYQLYVYSPSGQLVGYTASNNNNYELAEFTAPESGQYQIRIYRSPTGDNNEANNSIGIAWVKDATYLPDLRNKDGWVSEFYVRNDGGVGRDVTIKYFDVNGNPTFSDVCSLSPNEFCWIPVNTPNRIPAGTIGSAIVGGGEDVSVVVTQKHTSPETWAAYTAVRQPTTQVHIPLLHKNNYGINSEIYIQNIGTASTSVTINFKVSPGQPGVSCSPTYNNIPAQGLKEVSLSSVECVGATFVGSAFVTNSANNPLAVASTQRKSDNSNMSESSHTDIANTVYAPLIQNNNYGWIAGGALQNASGSANTITSTVYNQGGGVSCRIDTYAGTGARVSRIIGTPGGNCTPVASAIYSGGSLPVAATVNQVLPGTSSSTDYVAVATPSR